MVLLVAGIAKRADRGWPQDAAALGTPAWAIPVLPWFEMLLGAVLVSGLARPAAAALAGVVLLAFTGLLVLNLARGRRPPCACFGATLAAADRAGEPGPQPGAARARRDRLRGLMPAAGSVTPAAAGAWPDCPCGPDRPERRSRGGLRALDPDRRRRPAVGGHERQRRLRVPRRRSLDDAAGVRAGGRGRRPHRRPGLLPRSGRLRPPGDGRAAGRAGRRGHLPDRRARGLRDRGRGPGALREAPRRALQPDRGRRGAGRGGRRGGGPGRRRPPDPGPARIRRAGLRRRRPGCPP